MGKHVTKGHFRTIARATWVMGFYAALAFASSATPAAGDSKDACFGMACCPPGDAIVGIDPDTYDVQCRAVTQPNSED